MKPRKPTKKERRELLDYFVSQGHDDDVLEYQCIAVFDDYITDGPGYAGKVMVIVWSGSPSFVQVFIWDRPLLPEDKDKPWGQIDWHDGRHELKLTPLDVEAA